MFYPLNFPRNKENEILAILKKYEQTGKKLTDGLSISRWQMRFVLERHQQKFNPAFYQQVNKLLIKTRVRSASGIVPVSVFTNGVGCPFNCVYCSNEPDMPKSYFSDEPAVMRAIRNHFDPYKQVQSRLQMLYLSGHSLDKIELIIQGGTFSFYDKPYREWFVRRCFDAANTNVAKLIKTGNTTVSKSIYLSQAQRKNETTSQRIIGLTVETRPDFINPKEIKFLRTLGVTRVEIGVQAPDEKILKLIKKSRKVLINIHPHPDPDSVGSALALAIVIQQFAGTTFVRSYKSGTPIIFTRSIIFLLKE